MRVFGMDFKIITSLLVLLVVSSGKSTFNGNARTGFEARIAGGRPVSQGELPYQLSLQSRGRHICGAALIQVHDLQLAITAAHCVMKMDFLALNLVAGDINLNDTTGYEQTRRVVGVFLHDKFDRPHFGNDLALLFLDYAFNLNDYVSIIALPEVSADVSGNITVSGWGSQHEQESTSEDLRAVNLTVVDRDVCQEMWQNNPEPVEISDGIICLASLNGEGAPCRGDSGSPAVDNKVGLKSIVGVVSFDGGYCPNNYPSGFTYIPRYMDWITGSVDLWSNNIQ